MVVFPNAKINLGLHITEKRTDGFHSIETLFYPIPVFDVLECVQNADNGTEVLFNASGNNIPGDPAHNLCLKVYDLLSKHHSLPSVKIHLHKLIPTGAGLGGGSADAAFFIRLLNEKFSLKLSTIEMKAYAAQLGSDCAFFIENTPCFASGKGEVLERSAISLQGYYLLLVFPEIHISTAEAYSGVLPKKKARSLKDILLNEEIAEWRHTVKNDFEDSLLIKHPKLFTIKSEIYDAGAVYASMSGSGSAMYGIFKQKPSKPASLSGYKTWVCLLKDSL